MRLFKLLLVICLFTLFSHQESYSYLHCKGRDIVDSNDQKILLRGIGLGGWLVPEGYQLHIPGFGSPSSIRTMITELIGQENTAQFYQRYRANYVAAADIQKIAEWGFNSIRLPFNYRMLSPEDQPGVYLEEGFAIIDECLTWCKKYGLYLILDMHCAPGGQSKDNIADADGIEARLWTEPANQDRTVEIWRKIAERYANEEMIAGYDLINETVLPPGIASTDLRLLFMRITTAIREVDQNHIVFIEGNWYATDFTSLTPHWDVNLVYSFHKYWSENAQSSIQHYVNISNTYKVPLWMGESGENSNTWFNDCVQLMEKNNIGWCWWTHKKIETLTSPYSAPIGQPYQRVLDYWNNQADKPSPEYANNALLQMADDLALDRCEFHPDVLDALFRADFGTHAIAFKDHHIPGTIHSIDYDFGQVDVAYFDADYQNIGGAQWNKGWKYRNDGVDIELSNDRDGAQYNVGWIENGEWLLYTVLVDESAQYDIDFRVASPNSNGRLQLLLDNQQLTDVIAIPNTGGWQNWQTVSISAVSIPDGSHLLKVHFVKGDFNINNMRFKLDLSSIENRYSFVPVTDNVFFAQNYPNPFNYSTQIPIYLKQPQKVTIRIYDSRGTLVKKLFAGSLSDGLHKILWDGSNNQNTSVSSGLFFYEFDVDGSSKTKPMIFVK